MPVEAMGAVAPLPWTWTIHPSAYLTTATLTAARFAGFEPSAVFLVTAGGGGGGGPGVLWTEGEGAGGGFRWGGAPPGAAPPGPRPFPLRVGEGRPAPP